MKRLFLLSLCFISSFLYARVYCETNVILSSLPQNTKEGLVVQGAGLRIYAENPPLLALGQQVYLRGQLYPESRSFYADSVHVVQEAPPFWAAVSRFRLDRERAVLRTYGPEVSALILSLVFGNKNFLSPRFTENAKSSGMSHFFALSGLHLALASSAAAVLFTLMGMGRRRVLAATLPFSAAYLFIGGMGIPLIRAFLFHGFWALGAALRLNMRLGQVLALSFCLMAPWNWSSASFQLSFAALAGIVFLRGFWEELCLRFFGDFFGALVSTSLAAGLATLPLTLFYFGEFNLYFLLSNILILPFASLLVLLCLVAAFVLWPHWGGALQLFYDYLFLFCSRVAQIPHSILFVENKRSAALLIALSFFTICIMIKLYIRGRSRHVAG